MATLEMIQHTPHRAEVVDATLRWVPIIDRPQIAGLPQVVWQSGSPWREANLWALELSSSNRRSQKTVLSRLTGLHAYAKWLESKSIPWTHFPAREADRCLVRYRGSLMQAIDLQHLAASTAQQRMATVIRFYRWVTASGLLSPAWPMWEERHIGVHLYDTFGLRRTLHVTSTDLAIPNRKQIGDTLEDGLLPVSMVQRDEILSLSQHYSSPELAWLLRLGFGTGMRIGTLCDLRVATLEQATPDPAFVGWHRIAVGPGANPPVHTKYGITGQIWITSTDLEDLLGYIHGTRRLTRQARASEGSCDLVFLTRMGTPYADRAANHGTALDVAMSRLRAHSVLEGSAALDGFRFHQSRCTFATELARVALAHGGAPFAIKLVQEALLHRDEASSLAYIQFVQKQALMEQVANDFTRSFLGLVPRRPGHA